MKRKAFWLSLLCALALLVCGCDFTALVPPSDECTLHTDINADEKCDECGADLKTSDENNENSEPSTPISLDNIPEFDGVNPYVVINNGQPFFTADELKTTSFESYAELDSLGRCGITLASIGIDIMPTEDRGSIGMVKPSGWHTIKYDIVDGKFLYNRCHLIGFQLTGENANRQNLITGTKYMNVDGMLPFENQVADYVKETENHVMYRVTPIFKGSELVARGVLIEAYSVEDNGKGICFCVYVYNNQPGIIINYANGDSRLDDGTEFPSSPDTDTQPPEDTIPDTDKNIYIINKSTKKVHTEECTYAKNTKEENKEIYEGYLDDLLCDGHFSACKVCNPE